MPFNNWIMTVALAALVGPSAAAGIAELGHERTVEARPAPGDAPRVRTIELAVTQDGWVPAEVKLKKGEPVKLVVTRKVDGTCITDIVIKDYNIRRPLPLNTPVEIAFTPGKSGKVRYACAMDMSAGVMVVE